MIRMPSPEHRQMAQDVAQELEIWATVAALEVGAVRALARATAASAIAQSALPAMGSAIQAARSVRAQNIPIKRGNRVFKAS